MTSTVNTRIVVVSTFTLLLGIATGSYLGYAEAAERTLQLNASVRALEILHDVKLARQSGATELVSHLESELDSCIIELRPTRSFWPISRAFGLADANHDETRRRLRAHRQIYPSTADGAALQFLDETLTRF